MTTLRLSVLAALAMFVMLPAAAGASPAGKVAFGVYTPGTPDSPGSVGAVTRLVGRTPDYVLWYQSFPEPLFYPKQLAEVKRAKTTPMIAWEPSGVSLKAIAAGDYDKYLWYNAVGAAAWGRPMLVRFASEMNGSWFSWGTDQGNTAADYRHAWRHVVGIFREAHATNVKWVFSPNVNPVGARPFTRFYPGDQWVDWVGMDGYSTENSPVSFTRLFLRTYHQLVRLTSKPIMVAETGRAQELGNKAQWIRRAFLRAIPRNMPRIRAVTWFNYRKEADWRLNSSASALRAIRRMLDRPRYR